MRATILGMTRNKTTILRSYLRLIFQTLKILCNLHNHQSSMKMPCLRRILKKRYQRLSIIQSTDIDTLIPNCVNLPDESAIMSIKIEEIKAAPIKPEVIDP
jgi:hypothetical protein